MSNYIAFLRGINVGGRIIKMTDLKSCFDKAGFREVKTVLQTGNVVFDSDKREPELKAEIETILHQTFNYPVKVQVLSTDRLTEIIANYPFRQKDGFHSYVIFLENGLEAELVKEAPALAGRAEQVKAGAGVVYWQVERGQTLKSAFAKLLSKSKYKDFNTNRNLNTLRKLT